MNGIEWNVFRSQHQQQGSITSQPAKDDMNNEHFVDYQRLTMLVKWQMNPVISQLCPTYEFLGVFFPSDTTCHVFPE